MITFNSPSVVADSSTVRGVIQDQPPSKSLWQYIKQPLSYLTSTTAKVTTLSTILLMGDFGILLAKGTSIPKLLMLKDYISVDTAIWLNSFKCDFNFSVTNSILRSLGYLSYAVLSTPVVTARDVLNAVAPELNIFGKNFSTKLINSSLEELMFRGILQKNLIPKLAQTLPESHRYLLDSKVSRVVLTSILFALAHVGKLDAQTGVMPQLWSGLLLGTAAEIDSTLIVPSLAHALANFAPGAFLSNL